MDDDYGASDAACELKSILPLWPADEDDDDWRSTGGAQEKVGFQSLIIVSSFEAERFK